MPAKIRVGLLQSRTTIDLSAARLTSDGGKLLFKVKGSKKTISEGGLDDAWKVELSSAGGMKLFKNGNRVRSGGVSVFGNDDHPLVVVYEQFGSMVNIAQKNTRYAYGKVEIWPFATGSCGGNFCLETVVVLPMQKYLFGLGEVPSSWPAGALEAQALAGRTYAFKKVEDSGQFRVPCLCAVLDSTLDQAYIGDSKRTGSGKYWKDWKAAVKNTEDQVILHDGGPISALYSSSSGGHTENNENVWGGAPYPYLRGVNDGPDSVAANPNHKWKVTMSFSDFSSKLNSAYDVGSVKRFVLKKPFGVSGRVTVVKTDTKGGVKIVGTRSTERASGWSVRSALGLRDTLFRVKITQAVAARFQAAHASLDGGPGEATSKAYSVPRDSAVLGEAQDFEIGRMTYNAERDKISWLWGDLLESYDRMGREASPLGLPRSSVWGPGDYLGGTFDNGTLLTSGLTGTHEVLGGFAKVFKQQGSAKGALGLPKGDRKSNQLTPNGKLQRFTTGTIYKSSHGIFAVSGAIDSRYRQIGGGASECGYPTARADSSTSFFQHGSISVTPEGNVTVDCS